MTEAPLLWVCATCGDKTGGRFPQPALCRSPRCPDRHVYQTGVFGGILKAIPRATDEPLMAEMRQHAPGHSYESDEEIINSWIRIAKLGMQLPKWELIRFAEKFEQLRGPRPK